MGARSMLDHALLSKTLTDLRDEFGRGFYSDLEKRSGVTNIGRYARGDMSASLDTWFKLYRAMPERIPEPCIKNEGIQSTGDGNRIIQTSTYFENSGNMREDVLELAKILNEYASPREVSKLFKQWKGVVRDSEKL